MREPCLLVAVDDAHRARVARGAGLRAEMQAALARGEPPIGYRAEWLRATAHAVVALVARAGESFNVDHPDDAASLADLLDTLATARTMLLSMGTSLRCAASQLPTR